MDLTNFIRRENNCLYGPELNNDIGKGGLGCFLYNIFLENKNKIFQVHAITGETETYSSVLNRSIRVALEMKRRGITEHDIIVVCSSNSMDCFIPIFATQLLNACLATLDPSQSVRDIVYLLNLVEPKIIFVENTAYNLMIEAKKQFCYKSNIVAIGNHGNSTNLNDFLARSPQEEHFKPTHVEDHNKTAIILFSSGTTGMPKGICLTGYNVIQHTLMMREMDFCGNVTTHVTSFYWISALMVTLSTILKGGKKVILPRYNLDTFLKAIQDFKISFCIMASLVAHEMNKEICSRYDLSSIDVIIFGGSPISGDQISKCRGLLPNSFVIPAYGLTETSGIIAAFPKPLYEMSSNYLNSCGVPLPGVIIKIVNPETDEALGINQRGEIRISSKFQFKKYYKVDSTISCDDQEFVKTGDIGYFDENNLLHICDRIKDMFKYKSWHIVPASVESVIYQHPAVKEAVVIGIPHPSDGDHPMAVIVLKDEYTNVKEKELEDFVNKKVLDREKLRAGLRIVKQFPKTPSGKIPRIIVRKQVIERTL